MDHQFRQPFENYARRAVREGCPNHCTIELQLASTLFPIGTMRQTISQLDDLDADDTDVSYHTIVRRLGLGKAVERV
jgi:hypothetical protein